MSLGTCTLCPRLCRSACPVAVSTAREAAVPTLIADVLLAWERHEVDAALARDAAALCTGCGACARYCHLGEPLPDRIRAAQHALGLTPAPDTLGVVEGEGWHVAVESDHRRWAEAFAGRIGAPVGRLRTSDGLGGEAVGGRAWASHASALRDVLRGRLPVVADGGSARALHAAGVPFAWLHEQPGLGGRASCAFGGAGCCGAAGPLRAQHPADAARMAARYVDDAVLSDVRCAAHLSACGHAVTDVVAQLMLVGGAA